MASLSLLAPNASELECLAAEALAQIERVPVPLRDLWNPDICPVELLPYLAWAYSVDRWSSAWPERAKRDAIKAAYFIHAHKGTIGALRRVVEPLGYLIEVREWWEEAPLGTPGTFRLLVGVLDTGITEEMYQELTWLIDDAKPVSRHLVGLAIGLDVTGAAHIGAALTTGDELTVYPPASRDIEVGGTLAWGAREHVIDTMDIR
ncbi:phage tail protein I [Stutzerimonas chloritidismutans]|uniref:phage tail protein I n=1 Tax=Stutzerimonas chloritidismutans TaxID=203192 RepID=UPI0028B0CE8B|nr:phage tail protein I [Stutzerimonas chloritidismutans]